VVESLVTGTKPSTKAAIQALADLSARNRFLVVLERSDSVTWLSLRNAPEVHIVAVDQLNTYDVLASDDVVFTKGAFDAFVSGGATSSDSKATIVEAPAADAVVETEEKPAKKAAAKKAAPAKKVAEEPKAAVAEVADEDDKPALPKGAKAPLKSGKAPKGFEVKGNADSGKYHEPDGQWYDATEAEFYFKSAEDAEAAGFTRAGEGSDK
jgi:large subunit ribosomal protein L4